MKRKAISLFALAAVIGATTAGAIVLAREGFVNPSLPMVETKALSYNTQDIKEIRNEGGKYNYSAEYTEAGLVISLNSGAFTDWEFGLTNWDFPTPNNTKYYAEYTLSINVNGEAKGGRQYSKIALQGEPHGTGTGGEPNTVSKNDFIANTVFTIGTEFQPHTEGVVGERVSSIHLQLGALRNAEGQNNAVITVKTFTLSEVVDDKKTEVNRINFETAYGFASRWRASHVERAYCDNTGSVVTNLLRDYCALREQERRAISGEYVSMEGKVIKRFDDENGTIPLASNAWVGIDKHAHCEVTTSCSDVWRAGMFIDTGVTMATGKTYRVSFGTWRKHAKEGQTDFKVVLQKGQWAGDSDATDRYAFFNTPIGDSSITIENVPAEKKGTLWLLAQMGTIENEISIYNLSIQIDEKDSDGTTPIWTSIQYFAERFGVVLG